MARDPAASIRRALVALALLAGLWAVVVALTGGFRITLAGIRVSSRSTANPMLVALISTGVVIGLSLRSGANWRAQVHEDLRWWAECRTPAQHFWLAFPSGDVDRIGWGTFEASGLGRWSTLVAR